MSLDEIIRSSVSRAGIVRVRNALNPLLWLSAVTPTPSWGVAYLLRDDVVLRDILVTVGILPILATLVAYFVWAFRDPDRLQSEEFVLRQQELSLIERKGDGPSRLVNDVPDTDDLMIEAAPKSAEIGP